jgi:S1-C subfamily serine protease
MDYHCWGISLFGSKRFFGLFIFCLLVLAGCERIPEIERRTKLGKAGETSKHLVELRKWLWTCRSLSNNSLFSKGHHEVGEKIEEFVDYFHSKGLSTVSSEMSSSLLGTAVLWKEGGYLLMGSNLLVDVKEVECSNGLIPWTAASIRGFDRSLELAVLKLDPAVLVNLKGYIHWAARTDAVAGDEVLSVVSSAYPGQIDRVVAYPQPFPSGMHTGLDDDLTLFLPPLAEVSSGGLLVDSNYKVVGYLLPHQSPLWGAALSFRRTEFSVASIIEKGRVIQAYTGMKLGYSAGKFTVQQIEVGSPAYRAGLRVDDILVKWNKRELRELSDWQEVKPSDINRTLPLAYKHQEKLVESQITPIALE